MYKIIFIFFIIPVSLFSQQLEQSLFSSGSGSCINSSLSLSGNLGQNFIGSSSNSQFLLKSGYYFTLDQTVSVDELNGITPTEFELSQNYPNPFNPSTTIRYAVPNESKVSITVFNLLGQEVATLVNDVMSAGYHEVNFNASNISSGVYLYRINAVSSENSKEFTSTKKFILLK